MSTGHLPHKQAGIAFFKSYARLPSLLIYCTKSPVHSFICFSAVTSPRAQETPICALGCLQCKENQQEPPTTHCSPALASLPTVGQSAHQSNNGFPIDPTIISSASETGIVRFRSEVQPDTHLQFHQLDRQYQTPHAPWCRSSLESIELHPENTSHPERHSATSRLEYTTRNKTDYRCCISSAYSDRTAKKSPKLPGYFIGCRAELGRIQWENQCEAA